MAAAKKKLAPGRHSSTIKRERQIKTRQARNRAARSEVATVLKKTLKAIEGKDGDQASKLFIQAQNLIDRAVKRGLYHARTGSRKIARLHKRLSQLSSS